MKQTLPSRTYSFSLIVEGDGSYTQVIRKEGTTELWKVSNNGDSEFLSKKPGDFVPHGELLHDYDFADYVPLEVIQTAYELADKYDDSYLTR